MPQFNMPDPSDPKVIEKLIQLVSNLYDIIENPVKSYTPIQNPDESIGVGDIWYDSATGKFRVKSDDGTIKALKYE